MANGISDLLSNSPALCAGLFFLIGLCFGSFVTALAHRLPRGLNWTTERSRCTSCGHGLGPLDLVPVLSWVVLRGKCRHCDAPVSVRYPLIELGFGLSFALIAYWSGR